MFFTNKLYWLFDTVSSYNYCFKYSISRFCYYTSLFCACSFITTELTNYCSNLIFSYLLLNYNSLPWIYNYLCICNSLSVHDVIICSFIKIWLISLDWKPLSIFLYFFVNTMRYLSFLILFLCFLIILFIYLFILSIRLI